MNDDDDEEVEEVVEEELPNQQGERAPLRGLDEMMAADADLRRINYLTKLGCYREAERLLSQYGPDAVSSDEDDVKSTRTAGAAEIDSDDDETGGVAEVDSDEESDEEDEDDEDTEESVSEELPFTLGYAKLNMKTALAQAFDSDMAGGASADEVVEKMRQLTQSVLRQPSSGSFVATCQSTMTVRVAQHIKAVAKDIAYPPERLLKGGKWGAPEPPREAAGATRASVVATCSRGAADGEAAGGTLGSLDSVDADVVDSDVEADG